MRLLWCLVLAAFVIGSAAFADIPTASELKTQNQAYWSREYRAEAETAFSCIEKQLTSNHKGTATVFLNYAETAALLTPKLKALGYTVKQHMDSCDYWIIFEVSI